MEKILARLEETHLGPLGNGIKGEVVIECPKHGLKRISHHSEMCCEDAMPLDYPENNRYVTVD